MRVKEGIREQNGWN